MRKILLFALFFIPSWVQAETILDSEKVVERVLENNFGIKIAEIDRNLSRTSVLKAQSTYDTVFDASVNYLIDQSDQAIPLFGTDNRTLNYQIGFSQTLPTGTRLKLDWKSQKNTTNSSFATVNPFYESRLELSLRQPLLQNSFGFQDRKMIKSAKLASDALSLETERRMMEITFNSLATYWRWVWSSSTLQALRRSVEQFRALEKIADQKKALGIFDETDVLATKASRLEIENELKNALREHDEILLALKNILNLEKEEKIFTREGMSVMPHALSLDEALSQALEQRRDFKAALVALELKTTQISLAKNNLWPSLDLIGSLKSNGIEGVYSNSLNTMTNFEHPAYFIGGELRFPIHNRAARAELKKTELEKLKASYQMKELEKKISEEVTDFWKESLVRSQQVTLAKQIEKLHYQKWQLELKKFEQGRSGSDLVIRYQEDYLRAQRVTLATIYQQRLAGMALKLAINKLY